MSCPVSWKSTKVRFVTLAFTKGADTGCFMNELGKELFQIKPTSEIIKIIAVIPPVR